MNLIKFKAKNPEDVYSLMKVMPNNDFETINKQTDCQEGVEVILKTRFSLEKVRYYMAMLEDGNVMRETITLISECGGEENLVIDFYLN